MAIMKAPKSIKITELRLVDFITCICEVCNTETKYKKGGAPDGAFLVLDAETPSPPVSCAKCGSKFVVHVLHTDEKKIDAV